jgi:lysophospholipase L1-like esterase
MFGSLAAILAATLTGPSPARTQPVSYLAVGASDAVGVGATPQSQGYVFLIRRQLDQQTGRGGFENLGISGARVGEIAAAVERYLRTEPNPAVATVWTGANDMIGGASPGQFEAELDGLLGDLAERTRARIFIANLPDLTRLPVFLQHPVPTVTSDRLAAFNAAIARQAGAHGAVLVDLASEQVTSDLVAQFDGFHPSNEGHRALADRFLEAILPSLGQG